MSSQGHHFLKQSYSLCGVIGRDWEMSTRVRKLSISSSKLTFNAKLSPGTVLGKNFQNAPNFSKDPKLGPRTKQRKKKRIGACSLTHNTLGVGGRARVWDGTKTNSQLRV